jgi:hypothetical protein
MPGLLIALRFRVASRRRASHGGVRPLLTGPDRPSAFYDRVRRLPFDEPDEQLTPRQSGDDPGVRPVGQDLWSGRVRAGHPSSPGGPRSGPRCTGRQYPVTGCMPMSVPPTSVPRLAHRPSVHLHYAPSESATGQYPGRLTGPQYPSLSLRAARPPWPYLTLVARSAAIDLRVAWVRFTRISESLPTPHFSLT